MSSPNRSQKLRLCSAWLFACGLFVVGYGCAGKSERNGGDGSDDDSTSGSSNGGASGSGGTAPNGGAGPTGGAGGNSGTSSGGAGGDSGTGGATTGGTATGGSSTGGSSTGGTATGGEGGTSGASGAECATAADCRMVSDCCSCRSEPVGRETFCALDCVRDACAEQSIEKNEVECILGHCVINRSCDHSRVTCRAAKPECPSGTVPSVTENCWGPCIPPTDCTWVTDCTDCGDAICVELDSLPPGTTCRTPVDGCNAGNYCNCLGACPYACTEEDKRLACVCLSC